MTAPRITPGLLAAAVVLTSTAAMADEEDYFDPGFGARGPNVIVIDNLAGFMWERATTDTNQQAGTYTGGFLSPLGGLTLSNPTRLGYHRFLGRYVSIGMGLGFGKTKLGDGDYTSYVAAPRLGFAYAFSPFSAMWLRGGIAYSALNRSGDTSEMKSWSLQPGGELLFVSTPAHHVGVMFGFVMEWGVDGKSKSEQKGANPMAVEQSVKNRFVGTTFGMLFDF